MGRHAEWLPTEEEISQVCKQIQRKWRRDGEMHRHHRAGLQRFVVQVVDDKIMAWAGRLSGDIAEGVFTHD
jgi:hypothetical protein